MINFIYFDTEFTDFIDARLISIGCVTDEGHEFYAEITDTWRHLDCSYFVLETVLPMLDIEKHGMTKAQAADRLRCWIDALAGDEVVFVSDAEHDWPFVQQLFDDHGWPAKLRRKCDFVDLNSPGKVRRYQEAEVAYWAQHGYYRHHALHDARCLQQSAKASKRRAFK